jgi:S-adenosylmethionine:tRNA ribosyltransferase-isomerase
MMTPAVWPRGEPLEERLLVVEPRAGLWTDARIGDLPSLLRRNDLLVVNDAATVPASLFASTQSGDPVELRLAAAVDERTWQVVIFGRGDWRTPTEKRPPPPVLRVGDPLTIAAGLTATVSALDANAPRLAVVRFSVGGAALWTALYRAGRPVQYAHVSRPLELWHAQTPFASQPWAVEMPSAGRTLTWALLEKLRSRGVVIARLTHAAGLSSTGDTGIDAWLPLPERYEIPAETVSAVATARAAAGRVVAVGTSVVRALEGCARTHGGELVSGQGTTDLRIGARFRPQVVDGLLTGLHEVGTSHRELLSAFAPEPPLARAFAHAETRGYLTHEFGDACLIL